MSQIERQIQVNRQMPSFTHPQDFIPLPIIPLETIKEKNTFIFNKLNTNLCNRIANVNFVTKIVQCEIPNCNKFHKTYRFNNYIRNIDLKNCFLYIQ